MSYLNISTLSDKNPVERYMTVLETQRINWDSFEFTIRAFNETKVNMINLLFNVISNSISILFASNILKMKRGAVEEVIYGCTRGLDGRIPDCKLGMHAKCFNEIKKQHS